jgi:hypothetical protein
MPYTALQQMLDEGERVGIPAYDKGFYLDDLLRRGDPVITEQVPLKQSPGSVLLFYASRPYSKVPEMPPRSSGSRAPGFAGFIIAVCRPGTARARPGLGRSFWDALVPVTRGIGSYVNAISDAGVDDRVRASYGAKYDRLAAIKATYDPGQPLPPERQYQARLDRRRTVDDQDLAVELVVSRRRHADDGDDVVGVRSGDRSGAADDLVELGLAEDGGHLRGEEARRDGVRQDAAAQFTRE